MASARSAVYASHSMTVAKTRSNSETLRERLKEKRREWRAERKVALAKDPRVQAMKQTLKDRARAAYEKAKIYRKAIAAKQKERRRERKAEHRADRNAALRDKVHPATRS